MTTNREKRELIMQAHMNSFGIVVGLNVFEDIYLSLFGVIVNSILSKLSFQGAIEGFYNSVVIRVPLRLML